MVGAALLAAFGLAVASGAGAVPAVAATSSCAAAYSVPNDWGSGFTANLNITNNGTAAITGWTVTYAYAGSQTLANGWNGNWTQSGKTVTVTNASYNGSLAAGASTTAGANFNYSGTNAAPASVTCTPAGSTTPPPAGSITATPASLNVTQGSTGTFTLALSQAPTANVTVYRRRQRQHRADRLPGQPDLHPGQLRHRADGHGDRQRHRHRDHHLHRQPAAATPPPPSPPPRSRW